MALTIAGMKKKAEEQRKQVDKEYGAAAYGGSDWNKNSTAKGGTTQSGSSGTVSPDIAIVRKMQERHEANGYQGGTYTKSKATGGFVKDEGGTGIETPSYLDTARNATQKNLYTPSSLSDEEKEKRKAELEQEIKRLRADVQQRGAGIARASAYGNVSILEEGLKADQDRLATMEDELKQLERTGYHSQRDELSWNAADKKAEVNKMQSAVPTGTAGGMDAAYRMARDPEYAKAFRENIANLSGASGELAAMQRQIEQIDYADKMKDKSYEDTFAGQFAANFRQGRLGQDINEAFNRYLNNPTEENKAYAYTLAELEAEFQRNNMNVLDDEGAVLPWISKSAAGYLPQFWDNAKAEVGGAAVGAIGGALVGNPITGAKIGAVAGAGVQSYNQMRGAAYRELIAAGLDDETAREAANDEAFISSLIEMGDTAIDMALLGTGKLMNAVGAAAVESGSKNVAVKAVASMFGKSAADKAAKAAAKEAGKSVLRKGAEFAGGLLLNAAGEYGEEFSQSLVSAANQNRAETGKWDLVKETLNTTKDAFTGKNDEALKQAHAEGVEGFKIGLMFGGTQAVTNQVVSNVLNAKSQQQHNAVVDAVVNDKETLSALVQEGKDSGDQSVSAKIATEIEQKMDAGEEVTRSDVERLIASNDVYIEAETRQAAQEAVQTKETQKAERPKENARAAQDFAKKYGYGEHGTSVLNELIEQRQVNPDAVNQEFHLPYLWGMSNKTKAEVELTSPLQEEAFNAGKLDRLMSDSRKPKVTLWSKEAGLIENENTKALPQQTRESLHTMGQALGTKILYENIPAEKNANGYYKDSDGTIHIDVNTTDPVMTVAKHEITHRMQQLAPKEYNQFRDYAVQVMLDGAEYGNLSPVEAKQLQYYLSSGGEVDIDVEASMDELAAEYTKNIMKDETALHDFVTEMSQNEEKRTVGQKFFDAVHEFIQKVKAFFKGDKAKMDKAAKSEFGATVAELEKAEKLWKDAYKASEKSAQEMDAKAQKNTDQTDGVKYSLNADFAKQLDSWLESGKQNEHGAGRFHVGTTSDVLQGIGVENYDIYWSASKIAQIMKKHPSMTADVIKSVPQVLENPIMVMQSQTVTNRITMFGETMDADGKPVLVAVELSPQNKRGEIQDFAVIASAYGKNNAQNLIDTSDILYVDPDKKRTNNWLKLLRLQLPSRITSYGSIDMVTYVNKNVNGEIAFGKTGGKTDMQIAFENAKAKKGDDVQFSLKDSEGRKLTEAQTEYFKDSKVLDRDGNLLVLYHGTGTEFTVFDKGRVAENYGSISDLGFYFTPYLDDAVGYASNAASDRAGRRVMESYLNLKNPLVVEDDGWGSAAAQADRRHSDLMRWAKDGGHDGIIVRSTDEVMDDDGTADAVYIAFSPEQVKDVKNQKPTEAPDIRFSLRKDSEGRDLTKEQQDYFEGSKVVDDQGRLKVMYQGGNGDFTVFDRKKSKSSNLYGRGFYFTDSESHAKQYGNARAFYLNITNPVNTQETTITKAQMRKFMKAVAENEDDYSFENYGYGATVDSVLQSVYGKSDFAMLYDVDQTAVGNMVETVELFNEVNGTDFDGLILDTETVTFRSEQAKSVDNENPTSDPDIRFTMKAQNDLMKENAKLRETVSGLKEQFKRTEFAQVDKKQLDKFTKDLLKDWSSESDINEVRTQLDDLYRYMANDTRANETDAASVDTADYMDKLATDDTPTFSEAYRRAYEISRDILESASVVDDEMYQNYKDLRDRLRKVGVSISPENANDLPGYDGLQDFRKKNMGKIKMVKDGIPVDVLYQDLADTYPELFDQDVYTTPGDQLVHIADVLDDLRPVEANPYSHNMREAASWLANDILERFYELPQAKPTFADKAQSKLTNQVIKDAKKLEKLREQKNARIAQLIDENRQKVKDTQAKERGKRQEAVQQVKEHYKAKEAKASESRKARELRAKITRHASDMSQKLLKPNDKHHIPENLRGPVAKLLESINLESNYTFDEESGSYKKNDDGLPTARTKAFADLKQAYTEMASQLVIDPDLMGDDGLLSDVVKLADKRITDMTSGELQTVWDTLRAVEATILTANKMFSQQRFTTISEAAETMRMENAGKRQKTEYRGMAGKTQKLTGLDMMTPEAYFHRLGSSGDAIFRVLRDAQDEHIRIMKEVSDFTHEELKDVDVNKLEKETHTVTLGGEEVKLTTASLMELYVLMHRKQAVDHIFTGGLLPDEIDTKGLKKVTKAEPVRGISIEEVSKAVNLLTDEQKAVADKMQAYLSGTMSEHGNKASMAVYNYEKFKEKSYWPIRTNKQEISSDIEKDTAVTSVAGRGFTKTTKPNANTSVRLGSIFDTFATHTSEMATYAAYLGATEDVNRIRNFQFWDDSDRTGTVKGIIERVHGKQGTAYLQKLLADVANGVKGTHGATEYMSKLMGNYKAAAVGANLRVIIQQPTAILRSLDMIAPQYLAAVGNPMGGWKKAMKYAPIAQWKDWGYFDINTGRQMKDVLFDSDSKLEKTKQVLMAPAGFMDSVAWGQLWNAVEAETKAKHKELTVGSEEYYQFVAKRFTEIVDHSQVVDGILQRSQIMRSASGLDKMASSFMAEPTKQYNMMLGAIYDARNATGKARTAARKRLGRTVSALAVSAVVNAAAAAIIDAVRDDDKEKDYWEKWLAAFGKNSASAANPAGYVPYLKDVVSILEGYDVSRMDMESVEKTISSAQNLIKALSGEGKYTIASASATFFAEAARMIGVPVANIKRDAKAFAMLAAVESDNYLMQYRMEKASLDLNYAGNNKAFTDILYNAYQNDKDAYQLIYDDMVKSGFDPDKIQSGMEKRMKDDQGVKSVKDLENRYLSPENQREYDKRMGTIQQSNVWKSASSDEKDKMEERLHKIVTDTLDDSTQEFISGGKEYGLDDTEWLLYKLALDMADEPSESGKYGSYNNKEKAEAISNTGLGDSEIAYLWNTDQGFEAYAYGIDMETYVAFKAAAGDIEADKDKNGKAISGSKLKKLQDLANSLASSERDYLYLVGLDSKEVRNSKKYKQYFGE